MSYRYNLELMKFFFNANGHNEFYERPHTRVQILLNLMTKRAQLCDKLRNFHEIQLANEHDQDIQHELQSKMNEIQSELNALHEETEEKLRNIPPIRQL